MLEDILPGRNLNGGCGAYSLLYTNFKRDRCVFLAADNLVGTKLPEAILHALCLFKFSKTRLDSLFAADNKLNNSMALIRSRSISLTKH